MAETRKKFDVRTEPLVAEVGNVELKFVPEINAQEFLEPYRELQKVAQGVDFAKALEADPEKLGLVVKAMRELLTKLMLPESREWFEANSTTLSDRVMGQIFSWLVEQYNEGMERPSTPSSES